MRSKRTYTALRLIVFLCGILLTGWRIPCSAQQKIILTGTTDQTADSIQLFLDREEIPDIADRIIKLPVINKRFYYKWKISHPTAFFIGEDNYRFIEPGDSIHIDIQETRKEHATYRYSGKGAIKCTIMQMLDTVPNKRAKPDNLHYSVKSMRDYETFFHYIRGKSIDRLKMLEAYKGSLSAAAYSVLQIQTIAKYESSLLKKMRGGFMRSYEEINVSASDLCIIYDTTIETSFLRTGGFSDNDVSYCPFYMSYLREYALSKMERENNFATSFTFRRYYDYLIKNYSNRLLDRFMAKEFMPDLLRGVPMSDTVVSWCVHDYLKRTRSTAYQTYIRTIYEKASQVTIGSTAPEFRLPDVNGKNVSLSDFAGKTVLIDFWYTGCTPCAKLTPTIRKVEQAFEGNPNVVMLSIAIDPSISVWQKSVASKVYTTEKATCLYADSKNQNIGIVKDYRVTGCPMVFLIDKKGRIIFASPPNPRPEGDGALLIEAISKANQL